MYIEIPTSPGEILVELLEARNMKQKELANRIDSSEKHVSNIINAKVSLTYELAKKLEFVFDDYPASLWNNLESRYREALLEKGYIDNLNKEDLDILSKQYHFKELFPKIRDKKIAAINTLRLLGLTNFNVFKKTYGSFQAAYFNDSGDLIAQTLWLRNTEKQTLLQNNYLDIEFNKKTFCTQIYDIKNLFHLEDKEEILLEVRDFLNKLGVYFNFTKNITNSKVRGALTIFDGHPVVHMTDRYKRHDYFWFALIHELAHVLFDDITQLLEFDDISSETEIENRANDFARNFIIDQKIYDAFIKRNDFTIQSIRVFSLNNDIHPGMVLGRLQHDKVVEYGKLHELLLKF